MSSFDFLGSPLRHHLDPPTPLSPPPALPPSSCCLCFCLLQVGSGRVLPHGSGEEHVRGRRLRCLPFRALTKNGASGVRSSAPQAIRSRSRVAVFDGLDWMDWARSYLLLGLALRRIATPPYRPAVPRNKNCQV